MQISVKEEHTSHRCEDCGHFSDCVVTVTKDGQEVARIFSDGHLGGGDFDDNSPASAVAAVLRKLHPEAVVEVDGPYAD